MELQGTPASRTMNRIVGLTLLVLMLGAIVAILAWCARIATPETVAERNARLCSPRGALAAETATRDFVQRRLISPATAEFRQRSTHLGGCRFVVAGTVDSHNGFGAMIRSDFAATVRFDTPSSAWIAEEVAVDT